jgi:tRNA pseudouridine55 synthase
MISGMLLVNKPKNWTSFDVVKKVRNKLGVKKIGHVGSIDPYATGLLVLLVNKATKLSDKMMGFDKEYLTVSKFGIHTDTGDMTGKIIKEEPMPEIPREVFEAMIPTILKIDKQVPSKYSAIKINGKKAYNLARSGKQFDMPERSINIKEFELIDYNFPYFTWRSVVSKGTYIRTLTEQIAELFGGIAVSVDLVRTKVGEYSVKDSVGIEEVGVERVMSYEL